MNKEQFQAFGNPPASIGLIGRLWWAPLTRTVRAEGNKGGIYAHEPDLLSHCMQAMPE